jgi:hypothetical protein
MNNESAPNENYKNEAELIYLIHEKLGEISVNQYKQLPRKPKKTAKKLKNDKMPSQFELSKLANSLKKSAD